MTNNAFIQIKTMDLWDVGFFFVLLGVFVYFTIRTWPQEWRAWKKTILLGLRFLILIFIMVLLLQPAFKMRVKSKSMPVAFVVDSSQSMGISDVPLPQKQNSKSASQTRWDAALGCVFQAQEKLSEKYQLTYHTIDKGHKNFNKTSAASLKPKGALSDFSALDKIVKDNNNLKAVVLLSDGRVAQRKTLSMAARLGVPVYTVGMGQMKAPPDLKIEAVKAPQFAFKNTEVIVTAKVISRRLPRKKITVKIKEKGKTVCSRTVHLTNTSESADVQLSFVPHKTGWHKYQITLPVYQEEKNIHNNKHVFYLDVARDKIRVFYVSGRPGPQYAFLREQLKTNPSVDLVSFVILRDRQDVVNYTDKELSLIPFPSQKEILEEMDSYDVVILEQFAFSQFGFSSAVDKALITFVRKGGGLLLIADTTLLGPHGPYQKSLLKDILPFNINAALKKGPFKYQLHPLASHHPVMSLVDNRLDSDSLWKRLPFLQGNGLFLTTKSKGALVLAEARAQNQVYPVLAVKQKNKGRCMVLSSLNTWQWALQEAGQGRGTWAYQRFWTNVMQWVSASEDSHLVRLNLSGEAAFVGKEYLIHAMVRDQHHQGLASADVRAVIKDPHGKTMHYPMKSFGGGEYAVPFVPKDNGHYHVTVQAFYRQKKWGEDQGVFQSGRFWDETRDMSTDFDFLTKISEVTGGTFIPMSEWSPDYLKKELDKNAWSLDSPVLLWQSSWVLWWLIVLLLVDWTLRRKWRGV